MTKKIWALSAAMLGLWGCGSGNDPMDLFHATSATVPSMILPTNATTYTVTPYSSTQDGIEINGSTSDTVLAPSAGLVVAVATDATTSINVTIFYNSYVSTRVSFMVSTTVRVGDYVTQGQEIGLPTSGKVRFTVLANGVATCPESFLDSANRAKLVGHITGATVVCTQ